MKNILLILSMLAALDSSALAIDPIHEAAKEGNNAEVKRLLNNHADINLKGAGTMPERMTPLMLAVQYYRTNTVTLLLERGADVNAKAAGNYTALYAAGSSGYSKEITQALLAKGPDESVFAVQGITPPILWMANAGQTDRVKEELSKGTDINAIGTNNFARGKTALGLAIKNNHLDTIALLLEKGANLNVVNSDYFLGDLTALGIAAAYHRTEAAELLLAKRPDDAALTQLGWPPLIWAASALLTDRVKAELEKGVNVNTQCSSTNHYQKGTTALMLAAQARKGTEMVQLLLSKGADVNMARSNGDTALMLAAGSGPIETVKLLLDKGANAKAKDENGYNLLMKANRLELDIVKLLLSKGVDVNATNNFGETVLTQAAWGKPEYLKLLLDNGANIHAKTSSGETALMKAAAYGESEGVKLLLARGANAREKHTTGSFKGCTALMDAARQGKTANVKLLLRYGSDVNARTDGFPAGETALSIAAEWGHAETVKLLLDRGALLESKDQFGDTPLLKAVGKGRVEVIKVLLAKGADLSAKNSNGATVQTIAAREAQPEVMQLLIEKGVKVSGSGGLTEASAGGKTEFVKLLLDQGASVHENGDAALIKAVENGHAEVVKLLLEKGANPNAADQFEQVALGIAANRNKPEIAQLLLDKGADANRKDKFGKTILMHAADSGSTETVRLLLQRGADATQNQYGVTALGMAAASGKLDVVRLFLEKDTPAAELNSALREAIKRDKTETVKFLIEKGADPASTDKEGKNALHIAAQFGNTNAPEIMTLLLQKGVDIHAKDSGFMKEDALMVAAWLSRSNVVSFLLGKGANVRAVNSTGATALIRAAEQGRLDNVKLLLEKGSDIEARDKYGRTALILAAEKDKPQMIKLLLDNGADPDAKDTSDNKTALERAVAGGRTAVAELLKTAQRSRTLQAGTIEQLLKEENFDDEALTDALITAKNRQLPKFIMGSTVDQRVTLVTAIEKRMVRAQSRIVEIGGLADDAARQGKGTAEYRKQQGNIQNYIGVLKAIRDMLMQS